MSIRISRQPSTPASYMLPAKANPSGLGRYRRSFPGKFVACCVGTPRIQCPGSILYAKKIRTYRRKAVFQRPRGFPYQFFFLSRGTIALQYRIFFACRESRGSGWRFASSSDRVGCLNTKHYTPSSLLLSPREKNKMEVVAPLSRKKRSRADSAALASFNEKYSVL